MGPLCNMLLGFVARQCKGHMISLDQANQTTVQYLAGDKVVSSVVTDTLYVSSVRLDFSTGAMYADIARGTVVDGVFAQNYSTVSIVVNPDGSFLSNDGLWEGKLAFAPAFVDQLKKQFDQFVLASGLISGKAI